MKGFILCCLPRLAVLLDIQQENSITFIVQLLSILCHASSRARFAAIILELFYSIRYITSRNLHLEALSIFTRIIDLY